MSFRDDVLAGLATRPRAIPARWLYDEHGSALFEAITATPEYYPTRIEAAILDECSPDVARIVGAGATAVEWGAGAATKTRTLLRHLSPALFIPVDISGAWLREVAARLAEDFPAIAVRPVEADFTRPVPLPLPPDGPRLGFFPGSTIGNLEPANAVDLLRGFRAALGTGAYLLIGADRVKDAAVLHAAYDDAAGVTAAFNLNLLSRINRELAGTLPLDAFVHRVRWNEDAGRIEMHLEAARPVSFEVAGFPFALDAGETIHTENSHKYTAESFALLLRAGGWEPSRTWTDPRGWFSVVLAKALPHTTAP